MRSALIFLGSALFTGSVILNAVLTKKQFYPSVVYITKSNPSMAVIYFQSLVLVLMLGKLMRKIFLGTLRAAEFEHLMERFWYALTETCLAFTVFRDDFNPKFIALFTVLLFLKSFHWLAEDRVDYMERSPVIGYIFHVRVAALLNFLGILDYLLIMYAYQSTLTKGATVQLVFGFEYAILITVVANTYIKYVLHAAELRSDTPWENKAVFLLYTELVVGLIRVILYVVFVFLMVKIYTLPLFAFRPMYYTIRNFKKALNDVILSRRAIHNMNTLYPDATAEELTLSDNICIICREDMVSTSKKLPCGHIFHTACLRSWFQRQQTCPTCRLNILRTPITTSQPQNQPQNNNNQNANQNNNNGGINVPNAGVANNNPFMNLLSQNAMPNQAPPVPGTTVPPTGLGAPPMSPFFFPTLPFMAPYTIPPPPMPQNLDQLSIEELRAMEGHERTNVEERIKLLKNVQTMLNASVALMNQYQLVVASLPPLPIPPPTVTIPTPSTSTPAAETPTIVTNITSEASTSAAATTSTQSKTNDVKIEDLGMDLSSDLPSTSKNISSSTATTSTSTFIANESNANGAGETTELSEEANEIRKRRLQKFLQNN
ncbi:unnamed protein product [Diamesa hyperborea]